MFCFSQITILTKFETLTEYTSSIVFEHFIFKHFTCFYSDRQQQQQEKKNHEQENKSDIKSVISYGIKKCYC